MKILIVDDDVDYSNLVGAFVEKAGHEVIILNHSREVLDVVLEEKPELVLLDIIMPDMDGIAVAEDIIDMDPLVKILFMTALGDYPDEVTDEQRSKIGLLPKPLPSGGTDLDKCLQAAFPTIPSGSDD